MITNNTFKDENFIIIDGYKMLDTVKDRDGNILQAIVDDVFKGSIMSRSRVRENSDAKRVYGMILREHGYTYSKIG